MRGIYFIYSTTVCYSTAMAAILDTSAPTLCNTSSALTNVNLGQVLRIPRLLDEHVDRVLYTELAAQFLPDAREDALGLVLPVRLGCGGVESAAALRAAHLAGVTGPESVSCVRHTLQLYSPSIQRVVLEHLQHSEDEV